MRQTKNISSFRLSAVNHLRLGCITKHNRVFMDMMFVHTLYLDFLKECNIMKNNMCIDERVSEGVAKIELFEHHKMVVQINVFLRILDTLELNSTRNMNYEDVAVGPSGREFQI